MPSAVIQLSFDPYFRLGGQAVRWETLGVGGAIMIALIVAAVLAGRATAGAADDRRLRRDDLLFIVLGIVPGAVVGGRLTYVLIHLDYYRANPGLVVNPSSGGLALTGAVVLGLVSGGYVARLLEAPIGRWLDLAAIVLVLALGLGKLAEVLGGSGQGVLSNLGWATAYSGPGPWGVLAPELPAHPAQVYEAIGDAILLAVLLAIGRLPSFRRADGRRFAAALAGWAIVRFVVAAWWRDALVAGPLRVEQLLDIGLLLISLLCLLVVVRRPATIPDTTPTSASLAESPSLPSSTIPREDAQ